MKTIILKIPKLTCLRNFSLSTFNYSLINYQLSLIVFFTYHLSLFTPFTASAQNLDSLYSVWEDATQPDSVRVAAYQKYIRNGVLFSNPDSAMILAEALFSYAEKHNYLLAKAQGYRLQGNATYIKGIYPPSLKYHEKALKTFEEAGNKNGYAISLANIGTLYMEQGNYPSALEYNKQALKILEEVGDKQHLVYVMGITGQIYQDEGNYSRALESYEKALTISNEIGQKQGIAYSLGNMGSVYQLQNNYSLALEYHEKSLKIAEEIGDKQHITSSLNSIGNIYWELNKYPLALEFCQRSLSLAKEIGVLPPQKNAYQCLYNTYKAMGKSKEALVYLEKMNVIKDSLQAEETGKKLQQMEFAKQMLQDSLTKAEEARLVKEVHHAEVRKKNKSRNTAYVGGFIALILAGGFYSRWRYVHKARNIISKEKDRSDNLLLNILPAEIAAELKEKGRADARDFDMVSILFTDFKEFTQASEKLTAKELVSEINVCFEAFDTICERYNIEKIKTIGDAYMAAGGIPVPSDNSVKNSVIAALEMQSFIIQRKAKNETVGKPAFEMRVGIHTGSVVAGIVGVKKFQYDIWGDTVNTAARMESNGEIGKVNISQSTYNLLKDDPDFEFEHRGKIKAKGKGEVDMYFVKLI